MSELDVKLRAAAMHGSLEELEACLAAGDGICSQADLGPALIIAAGYGRLACLEALLAAGAERNLAHQTRGHAALGLAAAGGQPACVAALLAAGADPRVVDRSTLVASRRWPVQPIVTTPPASACC